MSRTHWLFGLAMAVAVPAQTLVLPAGAAGIEGSTANSFPWGRGGNGLRLQSIYDSSNFTLQGVTTPIVVDRLRWRPDASAAQNWAAGAYDGVTISMSTCPRDHARPSDTFAANRGTDVRTVFSGRVTHAAGGSSVPGPAPALVDVALAVPFVYSPAAGDLVVEIDLPVGSYTGTAGLLCDAMGAGSRSSRVYASAAYGSPTGTVQTDHGLVVELVHHPATGVVAAFDAQTRSGPSPLAVQFTDRSYSSDPGGVTSWAWDFDDDGVVDSTQRNPLHVFTTCGDHAVTLTVADPVHGTATRRIPGFIATDVELTPDFGYVLLAPGVVMYQDLSVPPGTSWAWDLDGDGVVDDTSATPVFFHPSVCAATLVTLTVQRNCRGPFTVTKPVLLAPHTATATLAGGGGSSAATAIGSFFDIDVTNPLGIRACAATVVPYAFTGPFALEVWLSPGSYVGRDTMPQAWRLAATGSGLSAGGSVGSPVPVPVGFDAPLYLPAGRYGVAFYLSRPGGGTTSVAYTSGPIGPVVGPDVTFTPDPQSAPGLVRTGRFGGGLLSPRAWNGALHYTTPQAEVEPGLGTYAHGCAGTMPASRLVPVRLPLRGDRFELEIDNLPQSAAIVLFGLDRRSSQLGPLPWSMASIGAPGCLLHTSADALQFVAGFDHRARFGQQMPLSAAVLSLPFYVQAVAFDAAANALGAVASDAVSGVVGI